MVQGGFRTEHHPPEISPVVAQPGVSHRSESVTGIIWLVVACVLLVGLVGGLIVVVGEPTAQNGYRMVMAALFLGGSFAWLTRLNEAALRRFFTRRQRPGR